MSTIGTTLFSQIEINGQVVNIADLDTNNGIYQLPAGYTNATVKYTMIDNSYIPNGVFEENSYITGVTLAYTIDTIASYSFHGVYNINLTDKNAILAINPYAFDAAPLPPAPLIDPNLSFTNAREAQTIGSPYTTQTLNNSYNVSPISWSSSDTQVATIDASTGVTTLVEVGTTYITAYFAGNSSYSSSSANYQLDVLAPEPDFYFEELTINLDDTSVQSYTPTLVNDTGLTPTFASSDSTIASVDQNGIVYYVGDGDCDVTATATDGTNVYTATVGVSCTSAPPSYSITLAAEPIQDFSQYDSQTHQGVTIACFSDPLSEGNFSGSDFSVSSISADVGVSAFVSSVSNLTVSYSMGMYYVSADITTNGNGEYDDVTSFILEFYKVGSAYDPDQATIYCYTETNPDPGPGPEPPEPPATISFSPESLTYPVGDKNTNYNVKIGTFWDTELASYQFDVNEFSIMGITADVGNQFVDDVTLTSCVEDPNISGTWYLYGNITTSGDGVDGDENCVLLEFSGSSPYDTEQFSIIIDTSSNA